MFSNLPVIIALIMLITSAPFLLLQNEEEITNRNAGYALYFMIVGLLWNIIQYLKNKHPHEGNISIKKLETQT